MYRFSAKIYICLLLVVSLSGISSSESGNRSFQVLANMNVYQSSSVTTCGLCKIDINTGDVKAVNLPSAMGLHGTCMSPGGKYVLGMKYMIENHTEELILVDLEQKKSFQLTTSPTSDILPPGRPSGTCTRYGFSPDNRFVVAFFPNGVNIKTEKPFHRLMPQDLKSVKPSVVFVNIQKWTQSNDIQAIKTVSGLEYPSFNPSGKRFVLPISGTKSGNVKIAVYEIDIQGDEQNFFEYALPYNDIRQASFIDENRLFLFNNRQLDIYDLIGSRINHFKSFVDIDLAGFGYHLPHMPGFDDFSNGLIAFNGDNFAFLIDKHANRLEYPPSGHFLLKNKNVQDLSIIRGSSASIGVDCIDIPQLPAGMQDDYLLYHYIYLPKKVDDIAIVFSSGWRNQVFRIVDFKKRKVSRPIPGFFLGVSGDNQDLIYLSVGGDTCSPYRYNSSFTFDTIMRNGKKAGVEVNMLCRLDMETGTVRVLVNEPSYTREAFFLY
jgi:hypothetical protein